MDSQEKVRETLRQETKLIRYYCVTCGKYISSEAYVAEHVAHEVTDLAEKCCRFLADFQRLSRAASLISERRQTHIKNEPIEKIAADIRAQILHTKSALRSDIDKSVDETAAHVQTSPVVRDLVRVKAEISGKEDEQLTSIKNELSEICKHLLSSISDSHYETADKLVDPEKLKTYETALKAITDKSGADMEFIQEIQRLKQTKVQYSYDPMAILGMVRVESAVAKPPRLVQIDRERGLLHMFMLKRKASVTAKLHVGFILPFRFVTAEAFGNLYVNGGDNDHDVFLKSHYMYDEFRGTLVPLAEMNSPRSRHALAATDSRLYAIGGENSAGVLSHCEYYDPQKNTWMPAPALNEPRCGLSACAVGKTLYVVGGWNQDYLMDVERLEGAEWQSVKLGKKCPLKPVQVAGLSYLGGDNLLIFGGYREGETLSKEAFVLNTKSLAVTRKKDMLEEEAFLASETRKEGELVCAAGYAKGGVHNYDAEKDEWTLDERTLISAAGQGN